MTSYPPHPLFLFGSQSSFLQPLEIFFQRNGQDMLPLFFQTQVSLLSECSHYASLLLGKTFISMVKGFFVKAKSLEFLSASKNRCKFHKSEVPGRGFSERGILFTLCHLGLSKFS